MTQGQAQRPPTETVLARFMRYAAIDTQSADDAPSVPSTAKQWELARLLVDELQGLGSGGCVGERLLRRLRHYPSDR
jgi:hypothetical protein